MYFHENIQNSEWIMNGKCEVHGKAMALLMNILLNGNS